MLKAAVVFVVVGLCSMVLGYLGILGLNKDSGEMILSICFIFSTMTFIGSAEIERKKHSNNLM